MARALALKLTVLANLFLVYISWGTSYIGFKLTLEVLGPFMACGCRMLFGGLLLSLALILLGRWPKVAFQDILHAAWTGAFLVLAASGFLCFGQQYIPSGVAAIISGSTPITMIIAAWLFAGEERPNYLQVLGLLGGSLSLLLLASEQYQTTTLGAKSLVGIFFVLMATFGWVTGSLLVKRFPRKSGPPPMQDCALLLLVGGLESLLLGVLLGEAASIHLERLNWTIFVAFSWMVVGGSIFAYACYFWLLQHTSIAVAVSYEYVVPVIGLLCGWLICSEPISRQMILASVLSIASVFLVIRPRPKQKALT